jgi:ribosome modulation factor
MEKRRSSRGLLRAPRSCFALHCSHPSQSRPATLPTSERDRVSDRSIADISEPLERMALSFGKQASQKATQHSQCPYHQPTERSNHAAKQHHDGCKRENEDDDGHAIDWLSEISTPPLCTTRNRSDLSTPGFDLGTIQLGDKSACQFRHAGARARWLDMAQAWRDLRYKVRIRQQRKTDL